MSKSGKKQIAAGALLPLDQERRQRVCVADLQ
jgi:hypothetical protein